MVGAGLTKLIWKKISSCMKAESGGAVREKPMWAEVDEKTTTGDTEEVHTSLCGAGMAANAIFGA